MFRLVNFLREKSERFHMPIHIALGIISGYAVMVLYPQASAYKMLSLGVIANVLPDIDHLFYFFWYGSKTDYSKAVKKHISNKEIRKVIQLIKKSHKYNTAIYSHNLLTLLIVISLFWLLGMTRDSPSLSVFFLSWSLHYIYDILEDFLFFKTINPNWFLKFNRNKK